jgi:hypothetical protein
MKFTGRLMCLVPLFLAVVVGCSSSANPGSVTGKVTYNGQLVPAGSVTFHIPTGGLISDALRDGKYSVHDLPTGEMVVTIETESANPDGKLQANYGGNKKGGDPNDYMQKMKERGMIPQGSGNAGPYVKIPEKYSKKETSPLKAKVTRGSNEFNFDLTD